MPNPSHVEHSHCLHCGGEVDEAGYSKSLGGEEATESPEEAQVEQPSDDAFFAALDKGKE